LETERIVAAAILQGDQLYSGRCHGDIIYRISEDGGPRVLQDQQGFLTSTGRFVNRFQAYEIAVGARQRQDRRNEGEPCRLRSEMVRLTCPKEVSVLVKSTESTPA
jgi:hypothetical protein